MHRGFIRNGQKQQYHENSVFLSKIYVHCKNMVSVNRHVTKVTKALIAFIAIFTPFYVLTKRKNSHFLSKSV